MIFPLLKSSHHSVTQMQSLKLRVWVILFFPTRPSDNQWTSVKLCQCRNRKWADNAVVIALCSQCRLRQAGLFCQLFSVSAYPPPTRSFEAFGIDSFIILSKHLLANGFCFPLYFISRAWKYAVFSMFFLRRLDIRAALFFS